VKLTEAKKVELCLHSPMCLQLYLLPAQSLVVIPMELHVGCYVIKVYVKVVKCFKLLSDVCCRKQQAGLVRPVPLEATPCGVQQPGGAVPTTSSTSLHYT
jgi:hypothetical protein